MVALRSRYYFIPEILAVLLVMPIWWAFDRTPPLLLIEGNIVPEKVKRGGTAQVIWRAKSSGRDCPGNTQREVIDSKRNVTPYLTRARKGIYHPDPDDRSIGTVTTPPLSLPDSMSLGKAQYRVSNFYYCNPLQRLLGWPIIALSPDIEFEVIP